ncbi:Histidine phosphatase superfamily clade 1 [uncultured virus]|nr:Histidine phosphatase superfamily clade 1 [uncultured virus]
MQQPSSTTDNNISFPNLLSSSLRNSDKPRIGKVYLLRHEKRGSQISFETPLLPEGLENAENTVCPHLERLSIGTIYSSPFVRTLQTIKPFCEKTGKKINLEWSLVESFPFNPVVSSDFDSIINHDYISFIPYKSPDDTSLLDFYFLKQRVKNFIESLDRSENVLLVTHMPVINAVLASRGFEWIEMYTHHQPGAILSMSGDHI